LDVRFFPLDLVSFESITRFLFFLEDNYGRLDILVNSAAICREDSDIVTLQQTLQTNFHSLVFLTLRLLPLMEKAGRARILNISSGDGELCFFSSSFCAALQQCSTLQQLVNFSCDLCVSRTSWSFGYPNILRHIHGSQPFYRLSKALVNRFTQLLDQCIPRHTDIIVNAVCPGDVNTAMADMQVKELQTVTEAVENMIWLLDLSKQHSLPRGSFLRKQTYISW
jgi:NAD(P)-dependent dehydrogenase (short-subunit alcohol dehydrogenase family)